MKFLAQKGTKYNFSPFYSTKEQAFFTEPVAPSDISIMIKGGYTSLDVSLISSTVYGVSGLNPQATWRKTHLMCPRTSRGLVKVIFGFSVQQGMGVDYATDWATFYDTSAGVVCIGNPMVPCDAVNVEFTNNMIASINNEKLIAIWLKPTFVK